MGRKPSDQFWPRLIVADAPQQFFDFEIDGGDIYAGTNIGVCKYSLSNLNIDDCQNVYDGMPNWATYSVGVDGTYVYGGTNSGVGLITKSNFQHDENWGQGTQTGNAVVEIMGDIAYIGTDGLGVLRYNIAESVAHTVHRRQRCARRRQRRRHWPRC